MNLQQLVHTQNVHVLVSEKELDDLLLGDFKRFSARLGNEAEEVSPAGPQSGIPKPIELVLNKLELVESEDKIKLVVVGLLEPVAEIPEDPCEVDGIVAILQPLDIPIATVLAEKHVPLHEDVDSDIFQVQSGALGTVDVVEFPGVDVDVGERGVVPESEVLQVVALEIYGAKIDTVIDGESFEVLQLQSVGNVDVAFPDLLQPSHSPQG